LKLRNLLQADFLGERLSGRVLPGGAAWQVIRADGVASLDARYTTETADGALIYVRNRGYRQDPCVATAARRAAALELEVFEVA
jgi:hypothetical protein